MSLSQSETPLHYSEVRRSTSEFTDIMRETGKEISGEELKLKQDLDRRAAAGGDSRQGRKDELMRATCEP
jgi:hypothetical protein